MTVSHFVSFSFLFRLIYLNDTMDPHQPQETLTPATELDEAEADAQAAAIDVPDEGEGGRLRMIVQLVKSSFGVKDLAAM
jgi:hypothetical protein